MEISQFRSVVWNFYQEARRDLPWRRNLDPYAIVVSEVMLQQTQVSRVIPKFQLFLEKFPTFDVLANATIGELLNVWQGLGYNRRALALQNLAKIIVADYGGVLPRDPAALETLPGIGKATARSILVFAFNQPLVFIETNIRRVFIHHFFADKSGVNDKQLIPFVEAALDRARAREWYWALMDYGSFLGRATVNANRRSVHYTRQSQFAGSRRQLRGRILKALLAGRLSAKELVAVTERSLTEVVDVLKELEREQFIRQQQQRWQLNG